MASFENDPTIPNEAVLWRRIPPGQVKWDEKQGRKRASSQAFQDHPVSGAISFYLASDLNGPEDALAGHEGYLLVSVKVGLLREKGFAVTQDPPMPGEHGHTYAAGKNTSKKRTRIAEATEWVVPPADVYNP